MLITLKDLNAKVQEYMRQGYQQDVYAAARVAQQATRDYIARTHPSTAFGGKKLGGSQIIIGKYDVSADNVLTNIYANYFSRWYNTGAYGRTIKYGVRRGQRGTTYPPRGKYFESNRAAIIDYFNTQIERYLERHISL